MALYKNANYLKQSTHANFDTLHTPGARTPDSDIYRCENCGDEIAHNKPDPLPPAKPSSASSG